MDAKTAIKMILAEQNSSVAAMGRRLKMTRFAVLARVNRKNPSLKTLDEMLNVMGYKIVVMPDTMPTPRSAYELDDFEDTKKEPDTL